MFITVDDCGYIFQETWGGRSALGGAVNERLCLLRFNCDKKCTFGNIICLTRKEALKHVMLKAADLEAYYKKDYEKICKRLDQEEIFYKINFDANIDYATS